MKKPQLIVEGGGFKIAFTAGVLDSFIAADYQPFKKYYAVSGGTVALSYFLSNQFRYWLDAMQLLAKDIQFTSFKRTLGKEGYMDIDYLEKVAQKKVPLDLDAGMVALKKMQVYFVATTTLEGKAAYLTPTKKTWLDILVASSTLPFVTKGKHNIDGVEYFDGGWSDPIPAKWAYEKGAKHILVLRTAPANRQTTQSLADYFGSIFYRNNLHLSNTFAKSHLLYNDAVEFLLNPPKDVKVEQIAPIKDLKSTTYTYTTKTLMSDYRYGIDLGLQYIHAHKKERRLV